MNKAIMTLALSLLGTACGIPQPTGQGLSSPDVVQYTEQDAIAQCADAKLKAWKAKNLGQAQHNRSSFREWVRQSEFQARDAIVSRCFEFAPNTLRSVCEFQHPLWHGYVWCTDGRCEEMLSIDSFVWECERELAPDLEE